MQNRRPIAPGRLCLGVLAFALAVSPSALLNAAEPATEPAAPPHAELANGLITAVVMLPDAEKGFYRGTRFDWSGIVAHVAYEGHTFFGGRVDDDGVVQRGYSLGTSDEFKVSLPLGAPQTQPADAAGNGEPAPLPPRNIRIGVGIQEPYWEQRGRGKPRLRWRLAKAFPWEVERGKDFVEFRQSVREGPWGYEYLKRVQLVAGKPAFTIARRFRNTGGEPIRCEHYCHNWTRIDGQTIGRQYHMEFSFAPRPQGDPNERKVARALAAVEGRKLLHGGDLWAQLGPQRSPADNCVTLVNTAAGAAMRLRGDWTPTAFNIYVKPGEACPEPFIYLDLKGGDERQWTSRYEFVLVPKAEPKPETKPEVR